MLDTGTQAPDWAAPDQDGTTIDSRDLKGHWVALWWYPKASTPG